MVFEWMEHRWLSFRFVILYLMDWKPLVKMKLVAEISLSIKVWDILFYLSREFDAGPSSFTFCGPYGLCDWKCVQGILGNLFLSAHRVWSYHLGVRVVLVAANSIFLFYWKNLEIVFVSFDPRELTFAFLVLDFWMTHGPILKGLNSYVVF